METEFGNNDLINLLLLLLNISGLFICCFIECIKSDPEIKNKKNPESTDSGFKKNGD
jgi:hypothetical protein